MPEPHASLQRRLLDSEHVVFDGSRIDLIRFGWSPLRKKAARTKPGRRGRPSS